MRIGRPSAGTAPPASSSTTPSWSWRRKTVRTRRTSSGTRGLTCSRSWSKCTRPEEGRPPRTDWTSSHRSTAKCWGEVALHSTYLLSSSPGPTLTLCSLYPGRRAGARIIFRVYNVLPVNNGFMTTTPRVSYGMLHMLVRLGCRVEGISENRWRIAIIDVLCLGLVKQINYFEIIWVSFCEGSIIRNLKCWMEFDTTLQETFVCNISITVRACRRYVRYPVNTSLDLRLIWKNDYFGNRSMS